MSALEPLKKVDEMKTVYNLHAGLISEYFNHNKLAQTYYNTIITDKSEDVSFRALQIISNSMIRNNRKEDAIDLVSKYYGASNIKEMLSSLSKKIKQSESSVDLLVNTPSKGASEVFLEIALLFKSVPVGYEYAQVYMAISEYFNPSNDVTKIAMADIFETRYMYKDANRYYDAIKKESEMYYPAQIKKANNLIVEEKYNEATVVLKKLLKRNPKNFQILFNL